ncbi:DUF4189 domain-containing protein [Nocardia brasiliensis]|uniref:DUF4189 domain-containing protein n=1 Tax=Nocardia brasiliensis TaxID=37326 RepID=UPI00245412D2|nr:DUF4189 domain-containing protein [Nocardia brasiliensis]
MSYPPGQYPGQPYDPNAQPKPAEGGQQAPDQQRSDPTMLNPAHHSGPVYQQVPPADPTLLNPMGQPQYGQPYGPQGQQYPSVPQYQQQPPQYQQPQYQQAPQQFAPQQGGFPPGPPPGQYPPQYGPGGSGSGGGGGGKILAAIGSVLFTVLVIAGIIGLKVWKNNEKQDRYERSASATTSQSAAGSIDSSATPSTRPSAKVPPPTTALPTTTPKATTTWIAATYNEASSEVHWATSTLSQEAASAKAQLACGPSCQEPVWSKDGCVAFAFGQNNGWGSDWGVTIDEAQDKAVARAQSAWNIQGPFKFWSKCAKDQG